MAREQRYVIVVIVAIAYRVMYWAFEQRGLLSADQISLQSFVTEAVNC